MGHNKRTAVLTAGIVSLLKDKSAIKVAGTLNADGSPYIAANDSLSTLDGQTLILSEALEKSVSNRNLVRGIWFDKPVSFHVARGDEAYYIQAKVYRCLIAGKLFEQMLLRKRAEEGADADISLVWEFIPVSVEEVSAKVLRKEQEARHPYFDRHLDRASIRTANN